MDLKYLHARHERDYYPLDPELMTIVPEITGDDKQNNLRAKFFGAACAYSRKLICSFLPKQLKVVLGQLLQFNFDRGMRFLKLHQAIRFKYLFYVERYIANNTAKR